MSFDFGFNDIARVAGQILNFGLIPEDEVIGTTYLGTPVRDNIIFPADDNEGLELSEDFVINDIVMRVDRSKNIIRTKVQGRDGDVNEFISNGDYNLNIAGLIVSPDQLVFPEERLRTLLEIDDFAGSVAIASRFLSIFGIQNIVIDRIEVQQQAGFYHQVPFVMAARSEDPIELQIQSDASST